MLVRGMALPAQKLSRELVGGFLGIAGLAGMGYYIMRVHTPDKQNEAGSKRLEAPRRKAGF
jgi:hypothetical protein